MKNSFLLFLVILFSGNILAQVGINANGASPDPKSILDVSSTDKGFLPPRMSTVQRDAIAQPVPAGLTIFNTTTNCQNFYDGTNWRELCGSCTPSPPAAPTEGVHVPSATQVIWNWNASAGATGYKYNTTNNYGSATDLGLVTTFTQTGLVCSTPYTLYVWAYNGCGAQSAQALTQMTGLCPISNFCGTLDIDHTAGIVSAVSKSVTYGTVSYGGKCWIDRNLGADIIATSVTDISESAAGWYWQFNRKQGRQNTGGTSNTPAWSITTINESSNWTQGNDPCAILLGADWRVPTESEWAAADFDGAWDDYNDAFSSPLKLHAAGFITPGDGTLYYRGSSGFYWTSTPLSTTNGKFFYVADGFSNMDQDSKADGFPLRCLRD